MLNSFRNDLRLFERLVFLAILYGVLRYMECPWSWVPLTILLGVISLNILLILWIKLYCGRSRIERNQEEWQNGIEEDVKEIIRILRGNRPRGIVFEAKNEKREDKE